MMKRRFFRLLILVIMLCAICTVSCSSRRVKKEKTPTHHCNLGIMYFDQGRIPEAISEIKTAIAMEPKNAVFQQWLGFIYFSSGDYKEAEETYLKALQLDPYLTEVHNYLGTLYNETGKREEALKQFTMVLQDKFYPTPEKVHYNLSLLYEKEGDLKEAVNHLRKAVEKNPKYYQAHYQLAKLLDTLGNYEDAIFEFKVAEISYKQDAVFHFLFAMSYMKMGDSENARNHFQRVVDLAPGTPDSIRARDILETLK